jgi:photosystem II stability/assembly factor-like uncharacterized protein
MKKSNLLLLLLMVPFFNQAQWTSQNPPAGVTFGVYYDVDFIDANTGWVCGKDGSSKGIIAKTTDAGSTWNICHEEATEYFEFKRIEFIDANIGFALGTDGGYSSLINTTDGGSTWNTIIALDESKEIFDFFVVENTLFVAYRYMDEDGIDWINSIMKSSDGGNTFSDLAAVPIKRLFFIDINNGYGIQEDDMTGETSLWKTTNGGETYSMQTITLETDDYLENLHFVTAQKGWACGTQGTVYGTTDGGTTWTQQYTSGSGYGNAFAAFSFVDEQKGFVVGANGRIFKTTDGSSWTSDYSGYTAYYNVYMIDANTGWAVGETIDKREAGSTNISFMQKSELITIYPTYSKGEIYINSIDELIGTDYHIIDLSGRVIKKGQTTYGIVNVNFPNGMYIFKIPGHKITSKFIIKK